MTAASELKALADAAAEIAAEGGEIASLRFVNALARNGYDLVPTSGLRFVNAFVDDSIAVVRYTTSTTEDDSASHNVATVYVGGVDDIREQIDHDSVGDDDIVIEDVMLLWADRQPQEFGFDDVATMTQSAPPRHGVFVLGDDKIIG